LSGGVRSAFRHDVEREGINHVLRHALVVEEIGEDPAIETLSDGVERGYDVGEILRRRRGGRQR